MRYLRTCLSALLALGVVPLPAFPSESTVHSSNLPPDTRKQIRQTLLAMPLAFEPETAGPGASKFVMRRTGVSASFTDKGFEIILPGEGGKTTRTGITFHGGAARPTGAKELGSRSNYFLGKDPARWRTGVANFAQLRYAELWPGIDLVFYGNGEHLEHDFVVAPGADAGRIRLDFGGHERVSVDRNGDLVVRTASGQITFRKPSAYQESAGGRQLVQAGFQVKGSSAGFVLGKYDHRRALTIDPVLVFSTLLAGSTFDELSGLAVDAQGNIYVTGTTNSSDFPTLGAAQPACAGCSFSSSDVYVSKLNPTGSALIYSTFLGGTGNDFGYSIGVDGTGNTVVAGITVSTDFPAVNPIGTPSCCNILHMFVASLSPDGSKLNYSGVVGPLFQIVDFSVPTIPQSTFVPMVVDPAGNAYAASQTTLSFPTTPGALAAVPAKPQVAVLVVVKISPTGSLLYSTAIPGNLPPAPPGNFGAPGPDTFFQNAIAVDAGGSAYVGGQANGGLPTTAGVIGPSFVSDSGFFVDYPRQGFVLKLNASASALTYATYVPGTSKVSTMRVDASGNAWLGGVSSSPSLPVSANAFQGDPGCAGCQAGYILKLNAQATAAISGTYLRGTPRAINDPAALAHIALDANGNVLATGGDGTVNFPMKNPLVQTQGEYVIELSGDLSTLLFSSGGPESAIEAAPSGKIILAGDSGFPTTPGAFQTSPPAGRGDLFALPAISAIDIATPAPAVCVSPGSLNFGFGLVPPGTTSAPQSSTLTNCGNADLHISGIASNSPDFSSTHNCPLAPAAVTAGTSCTVTAAYSPVDYKSGSIVITDDALLSPHGVGLFGFPKAPFLVTNPSSLTFPETPVTTQSGLGLTVINSGSTNMTVSGLSTTGDFIQGSNCIGAILLPPDPNPKATQHNICSVSVQFAPTAAGTRTGTLIINTSALDTPRVVQLQGLALTAWPAPAVTDVTAAGFPGSQPIPHTLVVSGTGFSRLTTVTLDGITYDGTGRTIISPQEVDLPLNDNDFGDFGEVPLRITTPTPGGGISDTVETIYAPVQIANLTSRTLEFLGALNLAVAPRTQLVYGTLGTNLVSPTDTTLANIYILDPATGRLTGGFQTYPHFANALAVSDDNQFLYIGFDDTHTVAQMSPVTGAANFSATLGSDPVLGVYNAKAIRVLPGQPHSFVVSMRPGALVEAEAIKVFDDATPRPTAFENGAATSSFPRKLLFVGNDASTLYSVDPTALYRFTISASGITLKDKTTTLGAVDFDTDGASLFLSTGAVVDPVTLAVKGTITLPAGLAVRSVTVEAANSRVIFGGDGPALPGTLLRQTPSLIQAFDTKTLAPAGKFTITLGGVQRILRWGTNGLLVDNGLLNLTRSSLTGSPATLAPFHIGANFGAGPIPLAQISQGENAVYQVGIIGVNGFTGPVTLACESLPKFASCSFSRSPVPPGSGPFTVTISTRQLIAANHPGAQYNAGLGHAGGRRGWIVLAGLVLMPIGLLLAGRRHRRKLITLCLLVLMTGCGGGGGQQTAPPPPPGNNTPSGIYLVVLTGTSSAGVRKAILPMRIL